MKKIMCLSLILIVPLLYAFMDKNESPHYNNPAKIASLMNFNAISDEAFYENFKDLFDDQRADKFVREKYQLVKNIQTSKGSSQTLALIEYENNKSLLVQFRYDKDTEKHLIYNVIEVPEDVTSFFEKEL